MKVCAIVPIKLNSRRLPNKNFLTLGNKLLVNHVLETLLTLDQIDEVFCYTSQRRVMQLLPEGVRLLPRPLYLDRDEVKANELFGYAVDRVKSDIIVLCHATGPFISGASITTGLNAVLSGEYDCSFSVAEHKTYCWFDGKPLNYDPQCMSQTQDLLPVLSETSGFYVFKSKDYVQNATRINGNVLPVIVDQREAVDIDEPEDFYIAQRLLDPLQTPQTLGNSNYFIKLYNGQAADANIRHICFDLDGVLINSLNVMKKSWDAVQSKIGINVGFDEYQALIGLPFFEILTKLKIPQVDHDYIKNIYDITSMELKDEIEIYPNALNSLTKLQESGMRLSIVTSKTLHRAELLVKEFFPNIVFDALVTPEMVLDGRGKPEPDQLLYAALKVGVNPRDTIYVGDMEVDLIAADAAGFQFVHAAWGYGDLEQIDRPWFLGFEDFCNFVLSLKG